MQAFLMELGDESDDVGPYNDEADRVGLEVCLRRCVQACLHAWLASLTDRRAMARTPQNTASNSEGEGVLLPYVPARPRLPLAVSHHGLSFVPRLSHFPLRTTG
jgi:hypothetical protein